MLPALALVVFLLFATIIILIFFVLCGEETLHFFDEEIKKRPSLSQLDPISLLNVLRIGFFIAIGLYWLFLIETFSNWFIFILFFSDWMAFRMCYVFTLQKHEGWCNQFERGTTTYSVKYLSKKMIVELFQTHIYIVKIERKIYFSGSYWKRLLDPLCIP